MKILLVDDHALFREGLHHLLLQLDPYAHVFEAESCEQAFKIAEQQRDLDLVFLDLSLPDMSGLDALPLLQDRHPNIPVVVLSGSEDANNVILAINRGARGFIPKTSSSQILKAAVKLILDGGIYLPPSVFTQPPKSLPEPEPLLVARMWPTTGNISSGKELGLTERQSEVLDLMVQGKPNKVIARELNLAEPTVKIHVGAVLKALKVTNRAQAVFAVARLGLKLGKADLAKE